MKKILLQFITIFTVLIFLFKYNIVIKNNTLLTFNNFIKNIIPSMFPIIIITNYIKYNISIKNKYVYFLTLCLSFAPSNVLLSSKENIILYSSNINPLFSFLALSSYLNKNLTIKIILINLLINYILLFLNIKKEKIMNIKKEKKDITKIITESITTLLNIFGVIIFFSIILSILNIFISKYLLFSIEISNGFNLIKSFSKYKVISSIFLNSFCGIAIYFQIKTINENINYRFLIKKLLLSLIITLITLLLI